MAIPPMVNGVLPPVTYPATLGEVAAAFDQPGSRTRPALHAALGHVALLIWSRDAAALLYVNGSYVTDKRDPLDVDSPSAPMCGTMASSPRPPPPRTPAR